MYFTVIKLKLMNIIERVKNILMTPKTEWDVINGETATPMSFSADDYALLLFVRFKLLSFYFSVSNQNLYLFYS